MRAGGVVPTKARENARKGEGESAAQAPAADVQPADAANAPAQSNASKAPEHHTDATDILGQVAWLMLQSGAHKFQFISDLEWLVLPPVMLRQFRVFRQKDRPVAYVSWAYVSAEVEKRIVGGDLKMRPQDWKSGDRLWIIDVCAPFGGNEAILAELRGQVLKGQQIKSLQPSPDGKGMAVVTW
jgi:cytolysin-activating lysine-acyltransferase